MGKYQKNIEAARRISVMQYLETYHPGELVRKTDKEYCTKTHSSLVITPANGLFHWFSQSKGGNNALDYLVKVEGIDAMSGATLRQYKHDSPWRSVHYLALGGLNHQPIDYFLQQHPEVKRVSLCFDRDDPGRNFTKIVAKRLAERGYIVQDTPPAIGKDYNDYLLAARRLISMER